MSDFDFTGGRGPDAVFRRSEVTERVLATVCIPAEELTPGQVARHVIRQFVRRHSRLPTPGQMLNAAKGNDPPLPLGYQTAAKCLAVWRRREKRAGAHDGSHGSSAGISASR